MEEQVAAYLAVYQFLQSFPLFYLLPRNCLLIIQVVKNKSGTGTKKLHTSELSISLARDIFNFFFFVLAPSPLLSSKFVIGIHSCCN